MVEVPTPLLLPSSPSLWSLPAVVLADVEELVLGGAGTVTTTVVRSPSLLVETEVDRMIELDVEVAGGVLLPPLLGLEDDGGVGDGPLEEEG